MRPAAVQPVPVILALGALSVIGALAWTNGGPAFAGLALAGALAGVSLLQASFGFTASWRAWCWKAAHRACASSC